MEILFLEMNHRENLLICVLSILTGDNPFIFSVISTSVDSDDTTSDCVDRVIASEVIHVLFLTVFCFIIISVPIINGVDHHWIGWMVTA